MSKIEYDGNWVFINAANAGQIVAGSAENNAAASGVAMTPDWHRWVAENVLLRKSDQSIVDAMVKAGFDQATAVREVNGAMQHPYVRAAVLLGVGANGQPPVAATAGAKAQEFAWFLVNQRRAARQGSHYRSVPRVKKPSREA